VKYSQQQIKDFDKKINKVTTALIAGIIASVIYNKKMNSTDDLEKIGFMALAVDKIEKAFHDSGYFDLVNNFVAKDPQLLYDLKALHKISGTPFYFGKEQINKLLALQNTDLSQFTGLGNSEISAIHKILMDSVMSGMSEREMAQAITKELTDDFQRYAKTYAQTSRNIYLQQAEKQMADNYKQSGEDVYWEYVGPEDSKNREECIDALNQRFFTDAEMQDFEAEGIRWNCRHIFMLVSKDAYDAKDKPAYDLTPEEDERRQAMAEAMNE
jgi:hypothetical protein